MFVEMYMAVSLRSVVVIISSDRCSGGFVRVVDTWPKSCLTGPFFLANVPVVINESAETADFFRVGSCEFENLGLGTLCFEDIGN